MKPILKAAFIMASIVLLLSNCKKNEASPALSITLFSPTSGQIGTSVIITGIGFSNTSSNDIVKFGSVIATVTAASSNQLTVTVPNGATTGKITVQINGASATSASDFVVLMPPTITSFSPSSGIAGTSITVVGTNFSTNISDNVVTVNGLSATVTSVTSTQLVFTVPAAATTGKIAISINGLTTTSTNDFTVNIPPTITSFSPAYGLPGVSVTITGTNFSSTIANNTVMVNNVNAVVTNASTTQLTITIPTNTSTGTIAVTVNNITANSSISFEVLQDIPRKGLVAFYPFSGNANDASGNGINGSVSGATLAANRFGTTNEAYSFDGTDYITVGNTTALEISDSITVALWVNIADVNDPLYLLSKYDGSCQSGYYLQTVLIYPLSSNTCGINFAPVNSTTGSTGMYYVGAYVGQNAGWNFFAVTLTGKNIKQYFNGTKSTDSGNSYSLVADCATDLILGGDATKNSLYKGLMGDITIYNRALSDAEITLLYNQTVTKY